MTEKLIDCPRCGSNACSEVSNEKLTVWTCFGCGFTSNTTTKNNKNHIEEVMPELFKALCFTDEKEYNWYPIVVTLEDKSICVRIYWLL